MMARRNEGFLIVWESMFQELGLSGVQLLLYARICGFCAREGAAGFYESRAKTAAYFGISERAVVKAMNALMEKGLVVECGTHRLASGRSTKRYMAVGEALRDPLGGGRASPEESSPETGATDERSSPAGMNEVRPISKGISKGVEREKGSRYARYDD